MAKSTLAFLLLLLSAMPAMAADVATKSFTLSLHVTPQGNAVYVEGKINGHPAILVLDTGSTLTECDQKICGKLSRTTASLNFGPWSKDGEDVRTRDFSEVSRQAGMKIDGVLGLMTMNLFRRVTVDFERSTVELEPR